MSDDQHGAELERSSAELRRSFDLRGQLELLPGGEGRTYRAGPVVYRHEQQREEARSTAKIFVGLEERGFRVSRPLRTTSGAWLSPEGWSAWSYVEGRPTHKGDLPEVLGAVQAFHDALSAAPCPPHLHRRDGPYDRADRAAWGELPVEVAPPLAPYLQQLAALRQPVELRPAQLVHGDLNEENILVAPGLPPAIIDFTPYWRPPEFAPAVLAYWLGAYRGDREVLRACAGLPAFDQMLVRVALRSVLIAHEFSRLGHPLDHARQEFETAVRTVVAWVTRDQAGA